jgi:arylsulfatase A-like enzyme
MKKLGRGQAARLVLRLGCWMLVLGLAAGLGRSVAAEPGDPDPDRTGVWVGPPGVWIPPQPPRNSGLNVLVILSDDQRADTIHELGNRVIRTPNLDRLCVEGTAFTRAYIMGALQGAVCVPSRAMLMSGRTLFRARENLDGLETWPQRLGAAGYRTFIAGKWHNQEAALIRSFQGGEAIFLGGMTDQTRVSVRDLGPGRRLSPARIETQPSSELFADAAIRFLESLEGDRPFCLYLAFTSPHDPRTPPEEFARLYSADRMPLPRNFLPEHPFDNGELEVRDEKLLPRPRDPDAVRAEIAAYYGMVSHMDAQVGRVLEALRRTGQYDRTLIVFAGDNGLALGSHGLLGKQNLYEHSVRVPLILAGPGVPRHRRSEAFCYLLDVCPTLCEMAGVPAPIGSEGLSLVPVLQGKTGTRRASIFTAYRGFQRAVRDERWKLIRYPQTGTVQLFDLIADPAERRDLSQDPSQRVRVAMLNARLAGWQRKLSDPLVLPRT